MNARLAKYDKRSRLESAFKILHEGKITKNNDGMFSFLDSSAGIVDLGKQFHDKCADFVYNCNSEWERPCKHILAAQLYEKYTTTGKVLIDATI